ncbi:MAG: TIGR03085 family metal-binding protein [Tetrasphaera sp.]
MSRFAKQERADLCESFLDVGPDAPTLCAGWTTTDLATHLVIRDGRPDLIVGPMLPVVGGWAKGRVRAIKGQPWPDLVSAVASGPPIYSPTSIPPVDEFVNHVEFFIHHEDVRRAKEGWSPRVLPEEQRQALWSALSRMARLMFRKAAVGVELVSPLGRVRAKPPTPAGEVVVEGEPAELLLAAYGRRPAAEVTSLGAEDAIHALWASKLGLA